MASLISHKDKGSLQTITLQDFTCNEGRTGGPWHNSRTEKMDDHRSLI